MFKVMQLQTIWFLGFMSLYVFSSINIYAHTSLKKYSLQIVSPVYGKKPYIQVPTAWISNKAKLEIIKTMHKKFGQKWKIQVVSIYEEKWEKSLKIHPAMNIGIYPIKKSKKISLIVIYPKDYRKLIEDPLADNPAPIVYIGSTRRLIFYHYSKKQQNTIIHDIQKVFKLKK